MTISRGGALTAIGVAAFAPIAASAADKITITVASVQPFSAAPYVALDKGYFAAEGLDTTLQLAGGGISTPALMSGTVDASGSAASALSAIIRGAPLRVVAVVADKPPYQMWAAAGIRSLGDLKGKMIGVASRGDTYEISARIALQDAGVPPDSVGYSPLGNISNMGAALESGSLQAIVLSTGESGGLKDHGILKTSHVLLDLRGKVRTPFSGLAMSEKMLYGNPALSRKILRAVVKAGRYIKTYKDGTVAILGKHQTPPDPEATALEYDDLVKAATRDYTLDLAAAKPDLIIRANLMNVTADKIPPVDKIYDFSLVRSINAELDAARWKPTA